MAKTAKSSRVKKPAAPLVTFSGQKDPEGPAPLTPAEQKALVSSTSVTKVGDLFRMPISVKSVRFQPYAERDDYVFVHCITEDMLILRHRKNGDRFPMNRNRLT